MYISTTWLQRMVVIALLNAGFCQLVCLVALILRYPLQGKKTTPLVILAV